MICGPLGAGGADLSIMIPTYNCAGYLERTLASLADQGVERAQVMVVDDCSTEDDPEDVVRRMGQGRVSFHRQPVNLGLVGNFNSCIGRAERRWVHLLHGDDLALPGAYASFSELISRHPDSRVAFGRCVIIGEDGVWDTISEVLAPGLDGELVYDPYRWGNNAVRFPGALFRRDAAIAIGAFDDRYAHAADWHLWWRLAKRFPTAYTNLCLGAYRRFPGNHSATLVRTASDLREDLRLVREIAKAEPDAGLRLFEPLLGLVTGQACDNAHDSATMLAHLRILAALPSGLPKASRVALMALAWAKVRLAKAERRRLGPDTRRSPPADDRE